MRRLFWKLFGAFWLTTIVMLTVAIFVSFKLADEQSAEGFADPREIDELLQNILQTAGIDGLHEYVSNPGNFPAGQTVYLIDESGQDLLARKLPERVQSRARRIWSAINQHRGERHNMERWSRRLPQSLLETTDGRRLLAMPGPAPLARFGFLSSGSDRWTVLALAAAISLLSFWLLSRSLTRPVARISESAARLAAGDMASRVGANAYSKDEIGQLAWQFDRMAEELDTQSRTRREMFRNIAHELRAPLTRLQITTELLQRRPEAAPEQLDRIRYEIERLENLASQVLALARAEKILDSDDVTPLTEVVEQIVKDADLEATARQVRLRYDRPDGQLRVKGNPDGVASAIENVVRNAIQNTPPGGDVTVVVNGGSPCTVTVSDTGPGVPRDMLDKIFEPFFRMDTNRPGAGIGLAITKRVLHQVGGELAASNLPGGGLRITMGFSRLPDG